MTDAAVPLGTASVERFAKQDRIDVPAGVPSLEYTGIVFSARSDAADVVGWVRFQAKSDDWSRWHAMHIVRSITDETVMGGYRSDIVRAGRFELRFEVATGSRLQVYAAGVFDNRKDADRTTDEAAKSPDHLKKQAARAVPALITRGEWNAEPFIGTPQPLANPSYNYMTFHHAAGFSATSLAEGLAQVKAIQDLHQNVRGWSDIGYQFVIDRGGRLYQGRPFLDASTTLEEVPRLALGAHVGGFNTGNIGICLLGCYHPPEGSFCQETITPEAYDKYVETMAFLSENYAVAPTSIRGHRDFSATACPGDNNYGLLPMLITDVENFVLSGGEVPEELTIENYPNPFSESATVRYYLVEDGIVSLKVYTTTGRELAMLADGFQQGDRWYELEVEGSRLSAGHYFYRIEVAGAGNRKTTRTGTFTVVR